MLYLCNMDRREYQKKYQKKYRESGKHAEANKRYYLRKCGFDIDYKKKTKYEKFKGD